MFGDCVAEVEMRNGHTATANVRRDGTTGVCRGMLLRCVYFSSCVVALLSSAEDKGRRINLSSYSSDTRVLTRWRPFFGRIPCFPSSATFSRRTRRSCTRTFVCHALACSTLLANLSA